MRGSIGDKQRLLHILDAIAAIEEYVKDAALITFESNSMMQFASIKQIEIIGEASNNITAGTKDKLPEINWPKIIGMRHILVHEYFGIDTSVIWQVINQNLPELKSSISSIIDSL